MARHPGFNASARYVFHPRLTKKQKDYILHAKKSLDALRQTVDDESKASISGLTVWFDKPMGFWAFDGVKIKTRTCHVNVWFYGVTWTATFNHFGDVSRAVTYSLRWDEFEKKDPLPTAPSGKGTTRRKNRVSSQKELKRDNRRRQKRSAKANGKAGPSDTRKAGSLRRRKRNLRKGRR